MGDIIKRLRDLSQPGDGNDRLKAAAEIERLRNLYRTERQAHYDASGCVVRGTEEWQAETEHFLEGGE